MEFKLDYRPFPTSHSPLCLALVPWDSKAFGFPIHELDANGVDSQTLDAELPGVIAGLKTSTNTLLIARLEAGDVMRAIPLGKHGFYHVETMCRLRLEKANLVERKTGDTPMPSIREAGPEDIPPLRTLASSVIQDSRFILDPHFSRQLGKKRYADWVEDSYQRPSDHLWCIDDPETRSPVSFFQFRATSPSQAWVGFGGLSPDHRMKGMGATHIHAFYGELFRRNFSEAMTETSVMRSSILSIYLRMGFQFMGVTQIFHRVIAPSSD